MSLPDIIELLKQLEADHDANRHLYRGQQKRYPRYQWSNGHSSQEVEALYPADFRFAYEFKDFSSSNQVELYSKRAAEARDYGRNIRDSFVTFLLAHVASVTDEESWCLAVRKELEDTVSSGRTLPQNSNFFRMAWSLAQHYFVATALTDVTFDLRVAAWFATQPWFADGEAPKNGQRGVMYRFDRKLLDPILTRGTEIFRGLNAKQGSPPAPDLFLEDIRGVPSGFARRPSAQHGASIYGLDKALVVGVAFRDAAIEAFEFEHRPGIDIGLYREDVVPTEDPFLRQIERFRAEQHMLFK